MLWLFRNISSFWVVFAYVLISLIKAFWLCKVLRVDRSNAFSLQCFLLTAFFWAFPMEEVSWTTYSGHISSLLTHPFSEDCQKMVSKQSPQLTPLCPSKGRIGSPVILHLLYCICAVVLWCEQRNPCVQPFSVLVTAGGIGDPWTTQRLHL